VQSLAVDNRIDSIMGAGSEWVEGGAFDHAQTVTAGDLQTPAHQGGTRRRAPRSGCRNSTSCGERFSSVLTAAGAFLAPAPPKFGDRDIFAMMTFFASRKDFLV